MATSKTAAKAAGDPGNPLSQKRRKATVYDAVIGRVGANGFLTADEIAGSTKALAPEEVLSRKSAINEEQFAQAYQRDQDLEDPESDLPASDLLKAVHAYASDFYSRSTPERGAHDFRSMDGTALMALGFLLESTIEQALGETGDMALVEPRSLSNGLPESKFTKHRIHGKVNPPPQLPPASESDDDETDGMPAKKQRR